MEDLSKNTRHMGMWMDVGIFQRDIVDMGRISILRAFFRGEAAAEGVCWLSRCILVNHPRTDQLDLLYRNTRATVLREFFG